jgi:ribosomal protein S18 acetylase RimI-like enzyme
MNNKHLPIRLGTRDDLVSLADIEIRAASLFPKNRIPQPPESLPYPMLSEAISQQLLFCAEKAISEKEAISGKNKIITGFAACHSYQYNNSSYLHLDEISVDPKFGQQGIGSQLMKYILNESMQRKQYAITLTTFSDFPWNAPFYNSLGFKELDFKESSNHIQAMLEEEQELGLKNRVAMIYKN